MARRVSFIVTARNNGFLKALDQSANRMDKFGRKLQRQGRKMSRYLTAPTLAAAGAAIKMAGDFESSMTKIETLVGLSREQVQGMQKDVLGLAGETGRAPKELADALFTVTSAGMRGAEAMEVLENASKAAAIGLGETDVIARTLTGVIASYGSENIDAAKATNQLIATVREGNLEAASLAPVLGRVTGLAAELGIEFAEVGASFATFTRLGIPAEEAATGLRGILNGLIKVTPRSRKAFEGLGTSIEEVRERIAGGEGLARVLVDLIRTNDGNLDSLGELVPNVRALAAVLGTAGAQGEEYIRIADSIKQDNDLVNEGFERVSETIEMKYNKALASVKVNAIEMGAILLPIVTELLEEVTRLSQQFSKLDDETKRNIIRYAALAATIGPLLIGLGSMIRMVASLTKGVTALVGWFLKLNLAMQTNVYLAVAAAIALIGVQIYRAGERAKEFNKILTDALTRPASSLERLNKAIVAVQAQMRKIREGAKGTGVDPTTLESYKELELQLANLIQKRNDLAQKQTWDIDAGTSGAGESVGELEQKTNALNRSLQTTIRLITQISAQKPAKTSTEQTTTEFRKVNLDESYNAWAAWNERVRQVAERNLATTMGILTDIANTFTSSFGAGMANVIVQGEKLVDVLRNIGKLLLSSAIQKGISILLMGGLGGGGFGAKGILGSLFGSLFKTDTVDDALIRSDGSVIKLHPDDDILAMKDFGNLQPAMSGSQVIHNMLNLDGRVVWENQKAVNYRRGR